MPSLEKLHNEFLATNADLLKSKVEEKTETTSNIIITTISTKKSTYRLTTDGNGQTLKNVSTDSLLYAKMRL